MLRVTGRGGMSNMKKSCNNTNIPQSAGGSSAATWNGGAAAPLLPAVTPPTYTFTQFEAPLADSASPTSAALVPSLRGG